MWNKDIIITLIEFIKFSKKIYYKNNSDKIFHINDKYFKNLYYKIKTNLKNFNLEDLVDIYEYSKILNNGENFYRNISLKMIISKEKKLIKHKCIAFFTILDIKRLSSGNWF